MSVDRDLAKGGGRGSYARACQDRAHRPCWRVLQRCANYSAFNGYRRTPSAYSEIHCWPALGGCGARWRSKAGYVAGLPDG